MLITHGAAQQPARAASSYPRLFGSRSSNAAPLDARARLRSSPTPSDARARLRTMALSNGGGAAKTRIQARGSPQQPTTAWLNAWETRHHAITVIVTASSSPLNPSTSILQELLLSLQFLQLAPRTPVLLSHDGPRLRPAGAAALLNNTLEFPRAYLQYLARVEAMLPAASACTGLAIRLLLRATNGYLAGNLAFALGHVRTPYVLKVEHDHIFVRIIDIPSVVRDLAADPRLKYVRFNRRKNVRKNCDNGDYPRALAGGEDQWIAQRLWGNHEAPAGMPPLRNAYTRTACFSDMNHLTSTAYYRNEILPVITRDPKLPPETLMQDFCYIARNHSHYGTYIFGAVDAPACITHVDAALHGTGELLPWVRDWLRDTKLRVRNGTEPERPFVCRTSSFNTSHLHKGNSGGGDPKDARRSKG